MFKWLLFFNSLFSILATGEYTSRRELYQFEKISHRDYMYIYALFLYIEMYLAMFTSLKIDGDVVCLLFAVNIAKFDNVNAVDFT